MSVVRFRRLSVTEAEYVIAEIWKCLEEHDFASPRMAFVFLRDGRIGINCRFNEPLEAKLVAWRFSDWSAGDTLAAENERSDARAVPRHSPFSRGRHVGAAH